MYSRSIFNGGDPHVAALLATGTAPEIGDIDPLRDEFARLSRGLVSKDLEGSLEIDFSDVLADLGMAYALRAEAQDRAVDYGSAIEYLGRSLKAQPDSPEALLPRASVSTFSPSMVRWTNVSSGSGP